MILTSKHSSELLPTVSILNSVFYGEDSTLGDPYDRDHVIARDEVFTTGTIEHIIQTNADSVSSLIPDQIDVSDFPIIRQGPLAPSSAYLLFTRKGASIRKFYTFVFGSSRIDTLTVGVKPESKLAFYHGLTYGAANDTEKQDFYYRHRVTGDQISILKSGSPFTLPQAEKNPDCWAAGWDFSGVPFGYSTDNVNFEPKHGGCLITPRHLIEAHHFQTPVGAKWAFIGSDGNIHYATSIGVNRRSSADTENQLRWENLIPGDLIVHTLNVALPPSVAVYPVAGSWFATAVSTQPTEYYPHAHINQLEQPACCIYLDQNRRARYHGTYLQDGKSLGLQVDPVIYEGTEIGLVTDYVLLGSITEQSLLEGKFLNDVYGLGRFRSGIRDDSGSVNFLPLSSSSVAAIAPFNTPWSGSWISEARANLLIHSADLNAIARGKLAAPTGLTVTVAPDPTL